MYKLISKFCNLLALILSHLMCIVVTYKYTEHILSASSAPANVTFLYAIPFVLLIIALIVVSVSFKIKAKKKQTEENVE